MQMREVAVQRRARGGHAVKSETCTLVFSASEDRVQRPASRESSIGEEEAVRTGGGGGQGGVWRPREVGGVGLQLESKTDVFVLPVHNDAISKQFLNFLLSKSET